jgi:hypothetical protein
MTALDRLIQQIQRNCDISDAQHSGIFSICGLALRLRDLFKWEQGLEPWKEGDPSAVLEWIGVREAYWETLAESEPGPLEVNGRLVDPFDTETVNSALAPHRLCYGAGYARGLKPTFFLAAIDVEQEIEGCRVYRLGRERARDLLTLPALSQNGTILLRRQSARSFLWDQIAYAAPSARRSLDAALSACGILDRRPSELRRQWDALLRVQEEIHLYHEIGEIKESGFQRECWQEIIAAFPLTRIELLARHVKDLLADTHPLGPLCRLSRTRHTAGVGLYAAFTDRVTRNLFPELSAAVDELLQNGDWAAMDRAVAIGRVEAQRYADTIVSAYDDAKSRHDLDRLPADIERLLGRYLDGESKE